MLSGRVGKNYSRLLTRENLMGDQRLLQNLLEHQNVKALMQAAEDVRCGWLFGDIVRQKREGGRRGVACFDEKTKLRAPHDTRRKRKKEQQKRKRYGAATNHGETIKRRTSMLKIQSRAPRERTTHTYPNIHKAAKWKKTETRSKRNMV